MPRKERRSNGPKNLWTIPELALTLYLRSRRVRDKDMTIVLNERYAPIVRRSGAIRNKMSKLRRAVIASGQIDLKYDRYFSAPMNVDRWIRDQVDNPDELSRLLTFTEHELEIMNTVSQCKDISLCTYTKVIITEPDITKLHARRIPGCGRPQSGAAQS